jgi:hypothetical protein
MRHPERAKRDRIAVLMSVTADPMLTNASGFDFHLEAESPAIGAGATTTALFDFDGNPRTPPFDIGAYQHE